MARPRNSQAERRRGGHHAIIDREGEHRDDQHRPPPEAIAEIADHRPGEELREREHGEQPARDARRGGEIEMPELRDQRGQHRHDDAEADHVDQHGGQHDRHGAVFETHVSLPEQPSRLIH